LITVEVNEHDKYFIIREVNLAYFERNKELIVERYGQERFYILDHNRSKMMICQRLEESVFDDIVPET
jgi:hypothetical protein